MSAFFKGLNDLGTAQLYDSATVAVAGNHVNTPSSGGFWSRGHMVQSFVPLRSDRIRLQGRVCQKNTWGLEEAGIRKRENRDWKPLGDCQVPITPTLTAQEDTIKSALAVLRLKLAKLRRDVDVLEKAIDALQTADMMLSGRPTAPITISNVHSGNTNRGAIVKILKEAGDALRISEIAKRAHDQELIHSKRGYDGVYASVSTVLTRNSKHVFMQIRRGTWDLRERSRRVAVVAGVGAGKSHVAAQLMAEAGGDASFNPFTKSSTLHK